MRVLKMAMICGKIIEEWQTAVDALPKRKQCKQKGLVIDTTGCIQKVRYLGKEIGFQMKCNRKLCMDSVHETIFPDDGWVPIHPEDKAANKEQIRAAYGDLAEICNPELRVSSKWTQTVMDMIHSFGLEGEELEVFKEKCFEKFIKLHHTGNHHRNHTIAVPTAAGQPLRG
jgi:hypothetical protein